MRPISASEEITRKSSVRDDFATYKYFKDLTMSVSLKATYPFLTGVVAEILVCLGLVVCRICGYLKYLRLAYTIMVELCLYTAEPTRVRLLKLSLRDVVLSDDVDLSELATRLDGYSASDICNLCR